MSMTEQQKEFVKYFVSNGGNGAEAARSAGYSKLSANKIAYQLMDKPHIQRAVLEEQRRVLKGNLVTKALAVLENILNSENTSHKLRLDVTELILTQAGMRETNPISAGNHVGLSELSLQELETMAWQLRQSLDLKKQIN